MTTEKDRKDSGAELTDREVREILKRYYGDRLKGWQHITVMVKSDHETPRETMVITNDK